MANLNAAIDVMMKQRDAMYRAGDREGVRAVRVIENAFRAYHESGGNGHRRGCTCDGIDRAIGLCGECAKNVPGQMIVRCKSVNEGGVCNG